MTRTRLCHFVLPALLCGAAPAAAQRPATAAQRTPASPQKQKEQKAPVRPAPLPGSGPAQPAQVQTGSAGLTHKQVTPAEQVSEAAAPAGGDLNALRAAAAAAPRDARAQHRLGLALLAQGDVTGALGALQQAAAALGTPPGDPAAVPAIRLDLAVAQVRAGRPQAGERMLRELITTSPPPPILYLCWFNLGVLLGGQGRVESAIEAYERAAQVQPTGEALFHLAEAYLRHFDRARAIDTYRRALTLQPDLVACANNLAKALLDSGDVDGSIKTLREAIERGGGKDKDPELYYNLAVALARKGEIDAAVETYRQAIALRPDYAGAHNNLAVLLGSRGGKQGLLEMLQQLQIVLKTHPDFALANYNAGVVLLSRNEVPAAILYFQRAIQNDPKMADAYRGLGDAHFLRGDIRRAKDAYSDALRLNPADAETQRQISLALARSGSPDEALTRLRELARQAPEDGRTRFFLARTLAEVGEAGEAEREYREALRLLPQDAEISFALAELLNAAGRGAEAVAQYEATLRIDKEHASAWFRIAQAATGAGDYNRAISAFQRAAQREPRLTAEAHLHLGEVYYRRGQLQKEIDAYREALKARPDYGEARAELAFALHRDKKPEAALQEGRQAVKEAPEHAKAHYYLGLILYKQGKAEEAIEALRSAARLQPEMAEAQLALGKVLWQVRKDLDGARAALEAALKARPGYTDARDALRELEAAPGARPAGP